MLEKFKTEFSAAKALYLRVKVHPNSSITEITAVLADDTIKIDVAAKPEKGLANSELIKFFAKEFGVEKNKVTIISGRNERTKLIKIISTNQKIIPSPRY